MKQINIYTKESESKKPSGLIQIKNKLKPMAHKTYTYFVDIAFRELRAMEEDKRSNHKGTFKVSFNEIKDKLGLSHTNTNFNLKKVFEELYENGIEANNHRLKDDRYNFKSRFLAYYGNKIGSEVIEFQIPDILMRAFIQDIEDKKAKWALIDYETTSKLKSKYSLRLFDIIMDYVNLERKYIIFSVEDLEYLLNGEENNYSVTDFKRYVLKKAKDEINKHQPDLKLSFTPVKRGRTIISYRFDWENNKNDEIEYRKIFADWVKTHFQGVKLTTKYGACEVKKHKGKPLLFNYESKKIVDREIAFEIFDDLYDNKRETYFEHYVKHYPTKMTLKDLLKEHSMLMDKRKI